jgi:hypothetical protein
MKKGKNLVVVKLSLLVAFLSFTPRLLCFARRSFSEGGLPLLMM